MLLDTSGLLCLHHKPEPFHDLACLIYDAARVRLTHSYVLAELVALAHVRGVPRSDVLTFCSYLLVAPQIEVVWVDETLHREGIALLLARLDKTYSLCDAVSFILMKRYGETEALTTDRHFAQEGFRRLLVAA